MQIETFNSRVTGAIKEHVQYQELLKREHQEKVTRLEEELKNVQKIHDLTVGSLNILLEKSDLRQQELENDIEGLCCDVIAHDKAVMEAAGGLLCKFCSLGPEFLFLQRCFFGGILSVCLLIFR